MIRRPPRATRTYTLFPYTTLFRSEVLGDLAQVGRAQLAHHVFHRRVPALAGLEILQLLQQITRRLAGQARDQHAVRRTLAMHAMTTGAGDHALLRSEERRVGKECVSTCRSRWPP